MSANASFVEEPDAAARVVAIIRGTTTRRAVRRRRRAGACEEGIRFVEVALTTPGALDGDRAGRAQGARRASLIGAGTVLTAADVADVAAAGAQFIVTPRWPTPSMRRAARGMPVRPGR